MVSPQRPLRLSFMGIAILEWIGIFCLLCFLAVLLFSGWQRADMLEEARNLRNELREIERTVNRMAEENQWPEGHIVTPEEYLKEVREQFGRMRSTMGDPFGNPHEPVVVGGLPRVPEATARELNGKVHRPFWEPYIDAFEFAE